MLVKVITKNQNWLCLAEKIDFFIKRYKIDVELRTNIKRGWRILSKKTVGFTFLVNGKKGIRHQGEERISPSKRKIHGSGIFRDMFLISYIFAHIALLILSLPVLYPGRSSSANYNGQTAALAYADENVKMTPQDKIILGIGEKGTEFLRSRISKSRLSAETIKVVSFYDATNATYRVTILIETCHSFEGACLYPSEGSGKTLDKALTDAIFQLERQL